MESSGCGPYETGRQAYQDAQGTYEAITATDSKPGVMQQLNQQRLLDACGAARVELGEYDRRIVWWLAGSEPEVVQVIAGWVKRASSP